MISLSTLTDSDKAQIAEQVVEHITSRHVSIDSCPSLLPLLRGDWRPWPPLDRVSHFLTSLSIEVIPTHTDGIRVLATIPGRDYEEILCHITNLRKIKPEQTTSPKPSTSAPRRKSIILDLL